MFKENYIIQGEIVCKTGLHIGGSNDNIDIGGTDTVVIRDSVSDLPFIPGSSLKGKLRSLLELSDKESAQSVIDNRGKPATDENAVAAQIFGVSADNSSGFKYPTRIIVRDSFPTEESIGLWEKQEDIVRTAWKEQKRTGDLDNYIAYLKSSGTLLSTAKSELAGLQEADKARKEDLERQAQAAHQAQEEEMNKFWNGVEAAIKSRKLGQYQIPEQIKITRGGKSMMATPADFYRYVSVTDKDGKTAYAKDCEAVSKEQQINDSLLKAYLMFTGGDYSSLVDMAIKEKEVKTLRLKAKDGKQASRRLTPKSKDNKSGQNMDFGF